LEFFLWRAVEKGLGNNRGRVPEVFLRGVAEEVREREHRDVGPLCLGPRQQVPQLLWGHAFLEVLAVDEVLLEVLAPVRL
jgi:hypothetical protein